MADNEIVARWKGFAPQLLSVLRIVAAFIFIPSGTSKLFGWPVAMPQGVTAPWFSEIWFAGVIETFGGALLLIGLCTRPIAFIAAGEMAVAYFQYHAPKAFWPSVNQGTAAALFCFIWLYVSSAGPGPWSVDAAIRSSAGSRR
jgi:putative oxidoreductase